MKLIAEPKGIADFLYGFLRGAHQIHCGEHHLFVHVLSEGYLHFLPELFLKLAGRYKEQLCQSLRSQGLMGTALYHLYRALYQIAVFFNLAEGDMFLEKRFQYCLVQGGFDGNGA